GPGLASRSCQYPASGVRRSVGPAVAVAVVRSDHLRYGGRAPGRSAGLPQGAGPGPGPWRQAAPSHGQPVGLSDPDRPGCQVDPFPTAPLFDPRSDDPPGGRYIPDLLSLQYLVHDAAAVSAGGPGGGRGSLLPCGHFVRDYSAVVRPGAALSAS